MPDEKQANEMTESSTDERKWSRRRTGIWIRVVVFSSLVVACGVYAGVFRSLYTQYSPQTCAEGNAALFQVDFASFPSRIGDQFNACGNIGDGFCSRTSGDQIIRGECRGGRMHGPWSAMGARTGVTAWSGTYCNGFPCGEFRRRNPNTDDEDVFRVEFMQLHGPVTFWEPNGNRRLLVSGRYDHGKRSGRWVRHAEPGHVQHSAIIYDDSGFVSTTTFYCTNGHRREVRGQKVFYYDDRGNIINVDAGAADASFCPLP